MTSYRKATELLNRILWRTESTLIKLRTLSDNICRIGNEISDKLSDITSEILTSYGFNSETGLPMEGVCLPDAITSARRPCSSGIDENKITETIAAINESNEEKIPFSPENVKTEASSSSCVYISVDEVCVKHQKASREEGSVRDYKFVKNTVAHIQIGHIRYVLTGIGMLNVFKSILAYLLITGQICREIVFLTDGANDLKAHINSIFGFHPYTVILDWFHLKKRCQESLSLSIKKKDKREAVLTKLLRYLWVGDVASAISYLSSLDASDIKSRKYFDDFLGYLDRKSYAIARYALRDKLGLRNSSNSVEKVNDLLVSQRQKKDGMAWSPNGSSALASLKMVYMNDQLGLWLTQKKIYPFDPCYEIDHVA